MRKNFVNTGIVKDLKIYSFYLSHDLKLVQKSLVCYADIHQLLTTLTQIVLKKFEQTEKLRAKRTRV